MHTSGTTMQAQPEIITGKLRMTKANILVQPLHWDTNTTIFAIRHGRPVRGRVTAVGPGEYPKRYSRDRSKVWESRVFVPTQVKLGDIVELGGLGDNTYSGKGYIFPEYIVDGVRCLLCNEKDVAVVRE